MKRSSPEIIYVHGSDSDFDADSDADVNEILASAPVTRATRSAKARPRFSLPPAIPRVSDERSDKEKPDPSPVTVRPIKLVRRNCTARDLFGTKGAVALPASSPSRQLDAYFESPIKITRRQEARQEADADSDFESPIPKPAIAPLGWSRHHEAPVTTHAASKQATPGDDSDSDYVESTRKAKPDTLQRSSPIHLRPMFDTVMSVVWKGDHHTHERVLRTHVELTTTNEANHATRKPSHANPAPIRRSTAEETKHPTRRPLKTCPEVPAYYVGSRLQPAQWPSTIARLAANFNPTDIAFLNVDPEVLCGCDAPGLGDCRHGTCTNARDGIFCDVYCCPFSGNCGNGLRESPSVRLMRDLETDELTLQATERIENGVVLGEYLGELSLETGIRSKRKNNEGYRLHFHRDQDAWGRAEVCVNALLGGSLMRFLNHSCSPAARFYEVANGNRRTIVATSVRVIRAGEEISVDYGSDLWFSCVCSKCVAGRMDSS